MLNQRSSLDSNSLHILSSAGFCENFSNFFMIFSLMLVSAIPHSPQTCLLNINGYGSPSTRRFYSVTRTAICGGYGKVSWTHDGPRQSSLMRLGERVDKSELGNNPPAQTGEPVIIWLPSRRRHPPHKEDHAALIVLYHEQEGVVCDKGCRGCWP